MALHRFQNYLAVKPSIVAIASRIWSNPEFPDIVGTGFIARPHGVILTNEHVVKAVERLPRQKDWAPTEWPADVLYLHLIPGRGMAIIKLPIVGVGALNAQPGATGFNYGTETPDLGFIHVKASGLQPLKIAERFALEEGDEVMVAGFPMGTRTLRAPGWVHQLSPTLQSGIVSCILPFRCENPHAIMLDIMVQGGSSGSPVLDPENSEVVGVVYAGLFEEKDMGGDGALIYKNTSHTLAIPANQINAALKAADLNVEFRRAVEGGPSIDEIIASSELVIHPPKTLSPNVRPLGPDEVK